MYMNEQLMTQNIVELKEDVRWIKSEMMTKADKQEILDAIANLATIVQKMQEDQVFIIEWLKRMQNQVDEQQKIIDQQAEEIRVIKLKLGLA